MFKKKFKMPKWEKISHIVVIIQTLVSIVGLYVIFQVPAQIKEWNLTQNNRSVDILLSLENRLRDSNNKKIITAIERKKPIFIENNGENTSQDVDYLLNDLMSISDIYDRGLRDCNSIYSWFSTYFDEILSNPEIRKYISDQRKINSENFGGLDEFSNEINQCEGI